MTGKNFLLVIVILIGLTFSTCGGKPTPEPTATLIATPVPCFIQAKEFLTQSQAFLVAVGNPPDTGKEIQFLSEMSGLRGRIAAMDVPSCAGALRVAMSELMDAYIDELLALSTGTSSEYSSEDMGAFGEKVGKAWREVYLADASPEDVPARQRELEAMKTTLGVQPTAAAATVQEQDVTSVAKTTQGIATAPAATTARPTKTDTPKLTDALAPTTAPRTDMSAVELYLGDAVEKDGYALVATQIEDPTTPTDSYKPEAGTRLVGVEVIVSSISGDKLDVGGIFNARDFIVLDEANFVYQSTWGGRRDALPHYGVDLSAGQRVRGWVAFTVPEGATPAWLKFDSLKASLTLPPEGYAPVAQPWPKPAAPLAKLGDVVEQYGYSLSATEVEDPSQVSQHGTYKPAANNKLVAIEIILGNVSAESALEANSLYAYLVDADGFVYGIQQPGREGELEFLHLDIGERAKGWVSFEIPEGAIPASLKYEVDLWNSKYLATGLTN